MDWSVFWTAVGGNAQAAAAIATFLAVSVALWLGIREGRRCLQARYDDARPILIIKSEPQRIPVLAFTFVHHAATSSRLPRHSFWALMPSAR